MKFDLGDATAMQVVPAAAAAPWWQAGLPAALVALFIGLLALWVQLGLKRIAEHQKDVAAAKLSLDLFEKRYELFKAFEAFLGSAPHIEDLGEMWAQATSVRTLAERAAFLFGQDVGALFKEAATKAVRTHQVMRRLHDHETHEPIWIESEKELIELHQWFDSTLLGLEAKFLPTMDFSRWR